MRQAMPWSRLPWHPILFAVVVVVGPWADSAVSPYSAIRALGVTVSGAIILTALLAIVLRSAMVGAIATSSLVAVLWTKHPIEFAIDSAERMSMLLAAVWAGLIMLAGLLVIRILITVLPRITIAGLTSVLNRTSSLLLLATVIFALVNGRVVQALPDLEQGQSLSSWQDDPSNATTPTKPNFYFILLDGYPRADVLGYVFDLDTSPFLDDLKERGFVVAAESHSDYLWTHLSLPSTLNMEYVENIPAMRAVIDGNAPRQPTLRRAVADNRAFDLLHEQGYATVAVAPGFEEVVARQADVYVDGGQMNEFELSLLSSTFAGDVMNFIAADFASAQQRNRILANLDALPAIATVADEHAPAFVFAHIPAPHQPTVFGEAGIPLSVPISKHFFADNPSERGENRDEFIARYRSQLPYLNAQILEAVDGILVNSTRPPVIILWADHGSESMADWLVTQPGDADPVQLLERTGTFFAALTPNHTNVFPNDISPVNILRFVFDTYLGTDLGAAIPPDDGGQIPPVDASVLQP